MSPRPNKFRFYLDENFPAPARKFLKSKGHNVAQVIDLEEIRSKSDFAQVEIAVKNKRILVTLDKDFMADESMGNLIKQSCGVLLIRSADPNSDKVISILKKILRSSHLNNLTGKICIASIDKISII